MEVEFENRREAVFSVLSAGDGDDSFISAVNL